MIITPESRKYILLQRTWAAKYKDTTSLDSAYEQTIVRDYQSIREYLPANCSDVLDIGSGIGGIDALISAHYGHTCNLRLLDKDGDSDLYYGYRKNASHYNSLSIARAFLVSNNVPVPLIFTYDANSTQFPLAKCQVIISLISCGFHYPVSTYLKMIKKLQAGIVILDIRRHSNQMQLLADNFRKIKIIAECKKYERVLLQ